MKNIKHLIGIIIISSLSCNIGYGQQMSNYKCSYQFDMVRDTLTNENYKRDVYVVQIGDKITKGYTYQKFYLDSLKNRAPELYRKLFSASVQEGIEAMKRTGDMSHVRNNAFTLGAFVSDIYKDYDKSEVRVRDIISSQQFVYRDELQPQQWEILEDTATILGYHSQKARCHFRGRSYEAWFTTEIPISEGPWKFYGLPGLITKVNDTQKHYNFELVGFQKISEPMDTKLPPDARKIDRKEFLRIKFGDIGAEISNMETAKLGISASGKKNQRNYDYIELDYK